MQYLLNERQARKVDDVTISKIGIPSMVLMERAALSVASAVEKYLRKTYASADKAMKRARIIAVCGSGNNGAVAVAAARILHERGYAADIFVMRKTGSDEFNAQLGIAKASGVKIFNKVRLTEYNIIIDGLFGIGISRNIEGRYEQVVTQINASDAWVLSVDIPSGINASDGRVMGTAVKANKTVTFGCVKIGSVLYPGAEYSGKVKVEDIGFAGAALNAVRNKAFTYSVEDLERIPKRKAYSNKGTYGRVLVIAGSFSMGGAASLAALSAYRNGAGLVKVFTHENQRVAVQKNIPEAIVETYRDVETQEDLESRLKKELEWATCVIIGPGLAKTQIAVCMTRYILMNSSVTTIVDADALNIIAEDKELKNLLACRNPEGADFILTPHIGEMARLAGTSVASIQGRLIQTAVSFASRYKVICVLKDARTIVADSKKTVYINTSGNSGMATGGSGDVLTGVIAGMSVSGLNAYEAACMGVFLHGLGGDYAASRRGEHGMKAGDIIDGITNLMAAAQNHK